MVKDDSRKAAVAMVLSGLAFAGMGAFVKLAPAVPVWDKVAFRNLITLFIALAISLQKRRAFLGKLQNQPFLFARSLLGIGGVVCYFYAIDHLLLADATMLARLSPFFVMVLAAALLKEPFSRVVLAATIVAFAGAFMVIKPRFDLSVIPSLVGLCSAVFAAGAYTALRFLRDREPPETIVLHFSLCSVLGMLPIMLLHLRLPSPMELVWLLGIGVLAAAGQLWLTTAYRHGPAAEVSIYGFAMILFAALIGFVVWREVPDTLSLMGGAMIIAGGTLVLTRQRRGSIADA